MPNRSQSPAPLSAALDLAVSHLVRNDKGRGPSGPIDAILRASFPDFRQPQIEEIVRRARALFAESYDIGEAIRAGSLSNEEAHVFLREAHPGFGEGSYGAIVAWGLFASR